MPTVSTDFLRSVQVESHISEFPKGIALSPTAIPGEKCALCLNAMNVGAQACGHCGAVRVLESDMGPGPSALAKWAGLALVLLSLLPSSCVFMAGAAPGFLVIGLIGWAGIAIGIKLSNGVKLWNLHLVEREKTLRIVYRK